MMIEITAAQARQMIGRCTRHAAPLELVPYADEGLDTILSAWRCTGWPGDADMKRLEEENARISHAHPVMWEMKPPEARKRITEISAEMQALIARCQDSWVLIVPGGS